MHINSDGYVCIGHNHKRRAVILVEETLGRKLPINAVVHHVDGNRTNDVLGNLVVCENEAYHRLLFRRTNAYKAIGNANYRKCKFCKQYDAPENLRIDKIGHSGPNHPKCATLYRKNH